MELDGDVAHLEQRRSDRETFSVSGHCSILPAARLPRTRRGSAFTHP
jgi:hypothetical protein